MSIWGSLVGGLVSFSFSGPIGALIGSMIGGRISSARRSGFQRGYAGIGRQAWLRAKWGFPVRVRVSLAAPKR